MGTRRLGVLIESMYGEKGTDAATKAMQNYQKAGEQASTSIAKADKTSGMLSSTLTKLVAGGALLTIGKQLLDFGKASIAVASDVEEASSKFQYTFGPAATDVGQRLDDFAKSANRSRFEMRQMAADVGAMTEATLGSKEAAGDMSVAITKLAVDLASFNNVTEEEALTALRAGLIGESEPMRRFGVLLSEASVQNYILANGMAKTKSEITDSMKMQARFNLIMQQTATAQGDAERTSDSYANVTRGLEASIKDLQAAVGEGLLPTMTKVKTEMAGGIGAFADFWSASNALKAAQESGVITQGQYIKMQAQLTYGALNASEAMTQLNKIYEDSQAEHKAVAEAAALTADELEQLTPAIEAAAAADKKFSQEADYAAWKIQKQDEAYRAVLRTLGEHFPALSQDTREMEEAAYASGNLGDAQDRLKGYLDADAEAMKAQEEAAKTLAEQQAALAAHSGDLAVSFMNAGEEGFNTAESMIAAADAAGADAETVVALGLAYGTLTDAQAENILKQVALQQEAEILGQLLAEGSITVEDAKNRMLRFAEGLDGTAQSAAAAGASARGLRDDILNLPDNKLITITVRTQNEGGVAGADSGGMSGYSGTGYSGQRAIGGPVSANTPYMIHPPELFIPDTGGQIVPLGRQSGGMGGLSVGQVIINAQPGQNGEQLYNEFMRKAAREARLRR